MVLLCASIATAEEIPTVRYTVKRFDVVGDNPLSAQTTTEIVSEFLGTYEGIDVFLAVGDALASRLREQGHRFHRVTLPA